MTKIIQPGIVEPTVIRFTCTGCKCVFEATKNLEAKYNNDQRDGDFWSCPCPTCKKPCTKAARIYANPLSTR